YCRTAKGVARAVQWCAQYGLEFSLRSGGHCYEGLSRSVGVIIDVRGLNTIEFNPIDHVLRVGSGVTLDNIYRTVAPASQAIPAGTCPTVGIAGHATAGGIGFFVRQFGLAMDKLTSAELVTADGQIIIVSEQLHPDLFWALRGAGSGCFGAVTM